MSEEIKERLINSFLSFDFEIFWYDIWERDITGNRHYRFQNLSSQTLAWFYSHFAISQSSDRILWISRLFSLSLSIYLVLREVANLLHRTQLKSWPSVLRFLDRACPHRGKERQARGLGSGFYGKSLRYIFTSGAIKAVGVPVVRPFVRSFVRSSITSLPRGMDRVRSLLSYILRD